MINRFIGFLLLPVFTAYLTPTDYGISATLGLITFAMDPIFSLGMTAATTPYYFATKDQVERGRIIWISLVILLISAAVLLGVTFLFSAPISTLAFHTTQYTYLVGLTLATVAVGLISKPFWQHLQFEEKSRLFVIITFSTTLISVILNVVFIVVLRRGVQGLIESLFLGSLVTTAVFTIVGLRKLSFGWDWKIANQLMKMGLPLVPSFAFYFVLQDGNKYILQWLAGLPVLGIYIIGFNLGIVLRMITGAFQQSWSPFFMTFVDKQEEARTLFGRIATYFIVGMGALTLLFFTFAKPVVILMTQPPFHEAYKIVGLSATASFLAGAFLLFLPGIYFSREIQVVSLIQFVACVLAVILNVLLIPLWGLVGAGIALVLGMLAMVALTHLWNMIRKRVYISVQYEWGRIFKFAVIYVVIAGLSLIPRNWSMTRELLLSLFLSALMVALLLLLLNERERSFIKGMMASLRKSR